jgi:dTMP kinase
MDALRGTFIVFEGADGSGKTTQFRRFFQACREHGLPVCDVREPGGTAIGERVREILLDCAHEEMSLRCEMLLYMASRAQLVHERIAPALKRGDLVLADRFVQSTIAYQGAAGGLPPEEIRQVAKVACAGAEPDLVVVFDVENGVAASRVGPAKDRIESRDEAFHARVRRAYLDMARSEPERFVVIDAAGDPDDVHLATMRAIESRLAPDAAGAGGR